MMEDYKIDIANTRKGCLGGSDAKLIMQVATMGYVPKSAYKRLAICKGLIEPDNITTRVMQYGDFIEQQIFEHLSQTDSRYQSNPCLVSETYSRKNVRVIDHVDFLLQDDDKRIIYLCECKASRYTTEQVRQEYKAQLYHHCIMGREYAERISKERKTRYKVKVILCHYDTSNVDIEAPFEFDPSKITLKEVRFVGKLYDMKLAMDVIDDFLETFEEYYEQEEIDYDMLPAKVQEQFSEVANFLREIKEREAKVEAFKTKLYDFLVARDISKIKCDDFSFTVVAPTRSVKVDYKKLFEEEVASKHPVKAKKLRVKYRSEIDRKGYVKISVKDK